MKKLFKYLQWLQKQWFIADKDLINKQQLKMKSLLILFFYALATLLHHNIKNI
jgi:hypothetical protein